MASSVVARGGNATVTVPAAGSIAVFTQGQAQVYQIVGYPNHPDTKNLLGTVVAGQTVFGAYASGAQIVIESQYGEALYEVGVSPSCVEQLDYQLQPDPVALNATGAVTAAAILSGIVTSTTAAAVAGTIPTGATFDAATGMAINDSVSWSVINTGPNTFTVTAASGHTIVGAAAVATATSGHFRTRKTAASTYITYRMA